MLRLCGAAIPHMIGRAEYVFLVLLLYVSCVYGVRALRRLAFDLKWNYHGLRRRWRAPGAGLFLIVVVRFRPSANIDALTFCCRSLSSSVAPMVLGAMPSRSGFGGHVCVFFLGFLAVVFGMWIFLLCLPISGSGNFRAVGYLRFSAGADAQW